MAFGSTQPLTEMSTRRISGAEGGRCVRLTTYHHPVLLSRNLGTLISWNHLGPSGPVNGLFYVLPFTDVLVHYSGRANKSAISKAFYNIRLFFLPTFSSPRSSSSLKDWPLSAVPGVPIQDTVAFHV